MGARSVRAWKGWALAVAALAAASCQKPKDAGVAGTEVGAAGGTVEGDGVTLTVPPGALDAAVRLQIAVSDSGAPEVAGRVRTGRVALITPERTEFLVPATVTFRYDPVRLPLGVAAALSDLRRTGVSRAIERLAAIAVDPGAPSVSGDTLRLGTFWTTAPAGRLATTVAVTPEVAVVRLGDSVRFAAEVRDQDGAVLPDATVAWSAEKAKVASIDPSGLARGLLAGTTPVVARSGAAQAKGVLKVVSASPLPRSFSFESPLPGANDLFAVRGDAARVLVAGASGQVAQLGEGGWKTLSSSAGAVFHDVVPAGSGFVAVGGRAGQGVLTTAQGEAPTSLTVPDTELESIWIGALGGMAVGAGPNLALAPDAALGWSVAPSPVSEPLLAVGGSGGAPWVVGARGSVYRRSEGAWLGLATRPLAQLQRRAVVRGEEAFATSGDTLSRFAQGAWTALAVPAVPALTLTALGASPDAIAVAGTGSDGQTTVLLDEGAGFRAFALGAEPLYALWGRSASDFWAAGRAGAVWHFDGASWSQMAEGPRADVAALAILDASHVYAAANACTDAACETREPRVLARGPDGRYGPMPGELSGELSALAVVAASDVWAVGEGGAFRYRGAAWEPFTAHGLPAGALSDVAACPGALYLAGAGGLAQQSGDGFSAVQGVSGAMRAVACAGSAAFAVGDFAIYRVENGSGVPLDPTADHLRQAAWRVAWASTDGDLFVGGEARWILHFDGAHFEAFDRPAGLDVQRVAALFGTGFGDVWAAGSLHDGTSFLAHFDGAFWTTRDPALERGLAAVRGLPDGQVWLGGDRGAILRGAP